MFGGSGAACSAIPKKDKVTYYYNEKNRFLENLFLVLADKELHQELITELEKIVGEIQGNVDEFDYYTNIDFEKEMKKYDNKRNKISDKEEKIRVENPTEFEMTYDEMWDFLQRFRQNLEEKEEDFVFVCNEYEYTKQELMKATETVVAFLTHYRVLIEYDEKYMKGIGLCKMMGNAEGKTTNLYDKNKEYIQHRCYCLYVYFSNLRREKKEIRQSDRVKCAAAEFYFLSFVTHGSTGVSPVLQMKKKEEEEAYSSVLKFLKTDFRKVIEAFHKEIQRVQCSQKDFHNMFQEHDDSNTLFYVDAPYIGTKEYIDLENEVEAFDKEQRDKLIVDITNAKGKVIFSCRATKNSKSKRRTQEELMAINKQIAIQILTLFCLNSEFGDRQWYALAIEKEKSLEQLLKENKIAEVMLTNFEIQSFEVEEKKNVRYQVYKLEEFVQILMNHVDADMK